MEMTKHKELSDSKVILIIKASELGEVQRIARLLLDIQFAYDNIILFEKVVDYIEQTHQERGNLPKLGSVINMCTYEGIEPLILNRVNIQSPGFWEFIGSLNPLEQIRKYINERHERNKDRRYRMRQEEMLQELEIEKYKTQNIKDRIEILKSLGYKPKEIRELVKYFIEEPLERLGRHQDQHLIDDADTR